MKTRNPTFELLREKRVLAVFNPATGTRFAISLRDWQGTLWAVRVHPRKLCTADRDNPFVTAHRMLSRPAIEEWLGRLRLTEIDWRTVLRRGYFMDENSPWEN